MSFPENKEDVALIWFSPVTNSAVDDLKRIKESLREMLYLVSFPTDIELCMNIIKSITEEKIFLIISGNDVFKHRSKMDSLLKLCTVFIFTDNCEK